MLLLVGAAVWTRPEAPLVDLTQNPLGAAGICLRLDSPLKGLQP